MTFRPLLAATVDDVRQVTYPKLVSPKLDGIRCIIRGGKAVSRNLKPIRNAWVQHCLKDLPDGMDGELIVGPPIGDLVFNRTTSGVMSESGAPEFKFYAFDMVNLPTGYLYRLDKLRDFRHPFVEVVHHWNIVDEEALLQVESSCLVTGYEGIMLRDPEGIYKFGRSTMNEQILLKLKRFRDGEAVICDWEEGVHNLNDPTKDAMGLTRRSSHQDNKVGSGRIGTLVGKDMATGEVIVISPGRMTQDERVMYFNDPKLMLGRIARYKTFDYGKVNASRFCTFQGFRDGNDV